MFLALVCLASASEIQISGSGTWRSRTYGGADQSWSVTLQRPADGTSFTGTLGLSGSSLANAASVKGWISGSRVSGALYNEADVEIGSFKGEGVAGAPLSGTDPVPFVGGLRGTYRFHKTMDTGDWVWPGGYALLVPGCPGDCNNNGKVATTEIGILTRIALGTVAVDECPSADANGNGSIEAGEISRAVNRKRNLCTADDRPAVPIPDPVRVKVWSIKGLAGAAVEFPILLYYDEPSVPYDPNNPSTWTVRSDDDFVGGLNADLVYPPSVLEKLWCKIGPDVDGRILSTYEDPNTPGRLRLMIADTQNYPAIPIHEGVAISCSATIRSTAPTGLFPLALQSVVVSHTAGHAVAAEAQSDAIAVFGPGGPTCHLDPSSPQRAWWLLFPAALLVLLSGRRCRSSGRSVILAGLVFTSWVTTANADASAGATSGGWYPVRPTPSGGYSSRGAARANWEDAWERWFVRDVRIANGAVRGELAVTGADFIAAGWFEAPLVGGTQLTGVLLDDDSNPLGTVAATVTETGLEGTVTGRTGQSGSWWWIAPEAADWASLRAYLASIPTRTPTSTPQFTPTPTPTPETATTPTLTPTDGRTATPTAPPPICEMLIFDSVDILQANAVSSAYPPAFQNCTREGDEVVLKRSHEGNAYRSNHVMVRWQTSLPPGKQVSEAVLCLTTAGGEAESSAPVIAGEWIDWEGACPLYWNETSPEPLALSNCEGECGASDAAESPMGSRIWLPLSNLQEIGANFPTAMRLYIKDSTLPVGKNELRIAAKGTSYRPRLLVTVCDPSAFPPTATPTPEEPTRTPTATPTPAACSVTTIDARVASLYGEGTPFPLEELNCTEALVSAAVGKGRSGNEAVQADVLLDWDLEALPLGRTVVGASLGLEVGGVWDDEGRFLEARWVNWDGECDASASLVADGDDALADGCGTHDCALGSFTPNSPVHLPLADAAQSIEPNSYATLRLRVSGGEAQQQNSLAFDPDTARLAVTHCDPGFVPAKLAAVPTAATLEASPTPTPTVPTGCQHLSIPVSEEYFTESFEGNSQFADMAPICDSDSGSEDLLLAHSAAGASFNFASNLVLRFDTSGIPSGLLPVSAALRWQTLSTAASADWDPEIRGDWIDGGGLPCAESDRKMGTGTALSASGECGTQCRLSAMTAGAAHVMPLSGLPNHYGDGTVGLRISLPGWGEGIANHVRIANSTNPRGGAHLDVLACPPAVEDPLPPGCQLVDVEPSEVHFVEAEGTPPTAPAGTGCTSAPSGDLELRSVRSEQNGVAVNRASNLIFGFDRADLPPGLVPMAAGIKVRVLDVDAAGHGTSSQSIFADWYPGEGCSASDYSDGTGPYAGGPALAPYLECGAACDLGTVRPGTDPFLVLSNGPLVRPILRVRMRLAGDQPNRLKIAGTGTANGPRMSVVMCEPPPTPAIPTPVAGCETHVIPWAEEGWSSITLSGTDSFCTQSFMGDGRPLLVAALAAGEDPEDPPAADAKILLRWPTDSLPSGKVVTDAWLRLFVGDAYSEDMDARLVADWYEWGPQCDASDAGEMGSDALASCGTACLLSGMESATYIDLPLSAPASHIASGAGAASELRLGVSVPQLCGSNMFVTAISAIELQGPGLVVRMCEP